jgi:protein-L-isoaspartate(D-aspartate) O-methyltransferase
MAARLAIALRVVDRAHFWLNEHGNQLHQTSAPKMIARMLRALEVKRGSRVLEIGTGSGYSTALLAELVGSCGMVVSIDVDPPVSERARSRLSTARYTNVLVTTGDGRLGSPTFGPYDHVVAWCSVGVVPEAWLDQSTPDAVLVVPLRSAEHSWIGKYRRSGDGRAVEEERFAGSFIPATATPFHPWKQLSDKPDQ